MQIKLSVGDVLSESADVLICPANPWLNMSGGVNGEILRRGGEAVQLELRQFIAATGRQFVEPATIATTCPGPLAFRYIVHAVAIDGFYNTSTEIVQHTLCRAWQRAAELGHTAAMPTLATGYGKMPLSEFANAFEQAVRSSQYLALDLAIFLRTTGDLEEFRSSYKPIDSLS